MYTLSFHHTLSSVQMCTKCPRLSTMVQVALEVISPTGMSLSVRSTIPRCSDSSRVLLEGLFDHFFSSERALYHADDVKWFLELANCQKEWGSGRLEDRCGILSGDLSDDLATQLEQSLIISTMEVRILVYTQ